MIIITYLTRLTLVHDDTHLTLRENSAGAAAFGIDRVRFLRFCTAFRGKSYNLSLSSNALLLSIGLFRAKSEIKYQCVYK